MRLKNLLSPTILTCLVALNSCAPSPEESAQTLVNNAKEAFAANNESKSLTLIDSLHATYPKCVAERRQADTLEWTINRTQINRSLPYLDSMLIARQTEFPELKKHFRFEKDEKYQDVGEFIHYLHRTENNTSRCYLKPYTNEKGDFLLMSYFVAEKATNHNMLTAFIGEMELSTLPAPSSDIHSYDNLGTFHETIMFNNTTTNGLHEFIANNHQEKIKITLSLDGEKNKYIYSIFENERKIFADTYKLAVCIKDINNITEQQNKLNLKLEILNRKLNK